MPSTDSIIDQVYGYYNDSNNNGRIQKITDNSESTSHHLKMKSHEFSTQHFLLSTSSRADAHDWKGDYFLWIPLLLASWRLAWKFQDPFISDWDGFDYTIYAVNNQPSALGLGRALFLGYNHLLWRIAHNIFDIPLEHAYLVFRYGVIVQSGPATVGFYALCKELTANRLAALGGAAIIAFSPFYITYSGRVMSEIPAFLLLGWAFWWMFRSLRNKHVKHVLIATTLVGLSANMREFALFYLWIIPIAAHLYGLRWRIGFLALSLSVLAALSGSIFWAVYRPEYYLPAVLDWWQLSARERQIHNVTLSNFRLLRTFAYQCSCAATLIAPFALVWLWKEKTQRALLLLGLAGLIADIVLLLNHDLAVNSRYLLTGLLGLAAVSGWGLAKLFKWRQELAAGVFIILAFLTVGIYIQLGKENYDQVWNARAARHYLNRIEYLPNNSVFIVGARTPLVNFYIGLGAKPMWQTIQPGSGWPDDKLDEVINEHLMAGHPVFVDFNRDLWPLGMREKSREWTGLEMIRRKYQLELLHDEFYRIVRYSACDWRREGACSHPQPRLCSGERKELLSYELCKAAAQKRHYALEILDSNKDWINRWRDNSDRSNRIHIFPQQQNSTC